VTSTAPAWPRTGRCAQCSFDWSIGREAAIDLIARSGGRLEEALVQADVHAPIAPDLWSPNQYLWHLVDVLRLGAERLWTLAVDRDAGVPAWDENELAAARHYDALSTVVGLRMYGDAVATWVSAARSAPPDAQTPHPLFGSVTTMDVVRSNAHEVVHHVLDIDRFR
jgi:hypothetical protein